MRELAQITNPVLPPSIGSGGIAQGGTAFGRLLSNMIGAMFIIGFVVATMYLITGAFHWITSSGDKQNLENARHKITNAVVGLVILASVWGVIRAMGTFLGIDLTNLPIPTIK